MYDTNDKSVLTNLSQFDQNKSKKRVVLTFDDGPSRALSGILNVLKKQKVHALFFWQSRLLYDTRPWERVIEEGHKIGCHSSRHKNLTKLSYEEQFTDIAHSKRKIEAITKEKIKYFRPPFGQYDSNTVDIVNKLNMEVMMWEISSMDWALKENSKKIITNIITHLSNGSIILLHELPHTVQILDELITQIKQEGYEIVLP